MRSVRLAGGLAFALWLHLLSSAYAEPRVTVLETYPPGDSIVLGTNQNLYVRLSYTTDTPVHIWVRPFFRGSEVNAGSNPSHEYAGTGEALGWFFLVREGDEVDEIRVTAGDGTRARTQLVATRPVRVTAGTQSAAGSPAPEWVAELKRQSEVAAKAAYDRAANAPRSAVDEVVFGGLMLAILVVTFAGFMAPTWAIWRWRGGWRIAATVPAGMLAFVSLRIVIGTIADRTSHNLWPFELMQASLLSLVLMAVLFAARASRRTRAS